MATASPQVQHVNQTVGILPTVFFENLVVLPTLPDSQYQHDAHARKQVSLAG